MAKLKQGFEAYYPLKSKVIRDMKLVTEYVGDLVVTGTIYCDPEISDDYWLSKYAVDIDYIKWNGNDIKEVLEVVGHNDEIVEYIIRQADRFFLNHTTNAA